MDPSLPRKMIVEFLAKCFEKIPPPGLKPSGGKMQQNGDDGLWKYAMILENSLCVHDKYHARDENLIPTSQCKKHLT